MDSTGLILNTLADGTIAHQLQSKLANEKVNVEVIDTSGMKISHCIGCNHCFLKTPGVCAIKDDYEQILKKLAHSDMAWLVSDTHFGFINSNGKKVMDRVLPLLNMGLEFREGEMRHTLRYGKLSVGLYIVVMAIRNCSTSGASVPQRTLVVSRSELILQKR